MAAVAAQVCAERRWFVHLVATAIALFGGLLLILTVRLAARIISTLRGKRRELQDAISFRPKPDTKCEPTARDWAAWLTSAQSIAGKIIMVVNLLLSMGSLGIYIYEAVRWTGLVENCLPWSQSSLNQIDLALNIAFLIYFMLRFVAAQDKLWFWLEVSSIIDFCTVPSAFVSLSLSHSWLGLRFIRSLRVTSLPDVLQHLNLVHSSSMMRSLQLITIFISVWLFGAGAVHLLENSGDPQHSHVNANNMTFGDSLYFTIVTMSTVGYGDFSPKTDWGKIFVSVYIFVALGVFASFIPEIVQTIMERSRYRGSYKKQHGRRHIVVCGAISQNSVENFLADFLHKDRQSNNVEVVVLHRQEPDLEFQGLLKRNFHNMVYFAGTVMDPVDCHRVCLPAAEAVVVLGNKYATDPDAEDASNIMRVIAVKNVAPKMRCIVQLLQQRRKGYLLNIPGWDWRLGDECLCTAELKLGLLAQSCLAPGFSTLLANLFSTRSMPKVRDCDFGSWELDYQRGSALEIYSEMFNDSFVGMRFAEAAKLCFSKLRLTLVALELRQKNEATLLTVNPTTGDDAIISCSCRGFFIADSQEEARGVSELCAVCNRSAGPVRDCCCASRIGTAFAGERHRSPKAEGGSCLLWRAQPCELSPEHQQQQQQVKRQVQAAGSAAGRGEQLDFTGKYHWCDARSFESSLIGQASASLRAHIIMCVFADSDSPLIGLHSFAMPLRAGNFRLDELRPIVFVGNEEYVRREWDDLKHIPGVYVHPASPMSRAALRTVRLNQCDMCVVISAKAKWTDEMDAYLLDRDVVVCTLNIKAMTFGTEEEVLAAVMRGAKGKKPEQASPLDTPIITEIFVDKNIQFLDQEDDDTEADQVHNSQPFACGNAFAASVLDSLMSTVFHSPSSVSLLLALVTGGCNRDFEQLAAEGVTLQGLPAGQVPDSCRQRSRLAQLSLMDPRLSCFKQKTYSELFLGSLATHSILCVGLYRYRDCYRAGPACGLATLSSKRVVIACPPPEFALVDSDLIFCFVPFSSNLR